MAPVHRFGYSLDRNLPQNEFYMHDSQLVLL
jgi:hypothetical protein